MTSNEAVLVAVEWILTNHRSDLLTAKQVALCFLPNFGHGDDVWLRTETLHIVGEVTTSGAGETWAGIRGPKRQNINKKIEALRRRQGVTHRYLFVVGDGLARSLQNRAGDDVTVVSLAAGE